MNKENKFSTVLPLICALAVSACAIAPRTSPPAKEAAATTAPESSPTADDPKLSAEEIGERFLTLIEGLKSREDLSLEKIQEVMGLRLAPAVRGTFYGIEGDLGNEWKYVLNFYPASPSTASGAELHFEKSDERFGDMTPICSLDFDHYHNALKTMEFIDHPMHGEIGQLESWRYSKFSKIDGSANIKITIIPQNVVPGDADQLCVKLISTLH